MTHQQANGARAHPQATASKERPSFTSRAMRLVVLSGISTPFEVLSRTQGQITHVLLTRSPLYSLPEGNFLARLACVRHAASVRSEPGSNSQFELRVCFQTDLDGPSELYCSKEPVGLRCTLFRCQRTIRQIDFRNLIFWEDSLPLSTVFRPRRIFSPPGPSKKITPAPRPCHSISNKFHEFKRFVEDWKAIVFAPLSQNQKSEKMTLSQSQKSIQGSLLLLSVYIFGQNPRESAFSDLDHAGFVQFQP